MSNPMDKKSLLAKAVMDSVGQQVMKDYSKVNDGLENIVSGMGGESDKSTYNMWTNSGKNLDWVQLAARYREDWVSQKVCSIIPQDMTRTWRHIDSEEGTQTAKQ